MHKFRRDIAKGHQDEASFVKPRVRDFQGSFTQDALIIKQDIQVQNPGAEPILARPTSHGMLNLLKSCEKCFWFKIGTNPGHTIYKRILALQINRFRLIQGRLGLNQATFALVDRCDSLPTIVGLMPNIRSDPYVGRMFYNPIPSIRSTASRIRSRSTVRAIRTYPSPAAPNPFPGVVTMPASVKSRLANPAEVCP